MNLYDQPPQQINNNGRPNAGNPEYFQFQNVSPEMIKIGLTTGQDMLSKQTDKWTTGAFGFWTSLKIYFSVSCSFSGYTQVDDYILPRSATAMSQRSFFCSCIQLAIKFGIVYLQTSLSEKAR